MALINRRSVVLEKISTYMQFPCVYWRSGCDEIMSSENINEHLPLCPFRKYFCPFQCPARFERDELVEHLQQGHNITLRMFGDGSPYVELVNYDFRKTYVDLITAKKEFFFVTTTITNNIWELFVLYIGPKSRAGRFCYTIMFDTGDIDSACLKISLRCRSINEDYNEIRRACKCVMLPVDVIMSSMKDGNASYYLNIDRSQ
jgi:hypothetical protein